MLADNALLVDECHFSAVEKEYNAGIRACRAALVELQPGELAQRVRGIVCLDKGHTPVPVAPLGTDAVQGRFYYIGAGVGCGIREALQVRRTLLQQHSNNIACALPRVIAAL
jgi:pyrimidine operon attenuation protein/uracil phosphoribosyltransferase